MPSNALPVTSTVAIRMCHYLPMSLSQLERLESRVWTCCCLVGLMWMSMLQHETIMQCAPWQHVCIQSLPTYRSTRISIACLLHFQPMHNISTGICWQGTMPSRSRSPRGNPLVGHGVGNDIPMDAQLGQFHKKQFLLNKLPANTSQKITLLAQQGGAHHMKGLSKLATMGMHPRTFPET